MSMIHEAYLFDSALFERELVDVIAAAVRRDDLQPIYEFIDRHIENCTSPYSGEELDECWREELEEQDIQELCDFALTRYYDAEDDIGLGYSWDALLNALKFLDLKFNAEYYVWGQEFSVDDFVLDPGGMGMGFVEAEDVADMLLDLTRNKAAFSEKIKDNNIECEELLYELSLEELEEAYDELINLFEIAKSERQGLLFVF